MNNSRLLELAGIKKDSIDNQIVSFFKKNPTPSDDAVHGLADKIGIEHDKLEERIYNMLSNLLNNK